MKTMLLHSGMGIFFMGTVIWEDTGIFFPRPVFIAGKRLIERDGRGAFLTNRQTMYNDPADFPNIDTSGIFSHNFGEFRRLVEILEPRSRL